MTGRGLGGGGLRLGSDRSQGPKPRRLGWLLLRGLGRGFGLGELDRKVLDQVRWLSA